MTMYTSRNIARLAILCLDKLNFRKRKYLGEELLPKNIIFKFPRTMRILSIVTVNRQHQNILNLIDL